MVEAPGHLSASPAAPPGVPDWEDEGPSTAALMAAGEECSAALFSGGSGAVSSDLFGDHVASLHADSDIGFSKEYEEIQRSTGKEGDLPFEHCKHPENKGKNRYLNIVACA